MILVKNVGEPIKFTKVEDLSGFSAGAARGGETVQVWTKLSVTSDEPIFHLLVENLASVIRAMGQKEGVTADIRRADVVLLVLKPDMTAELWLDSAAIQLGCAVKKAMPAGSVIYESDIADITTMSFPCVTIEKRDKVLCVFRQDWRFGFAFDMNPGGDLDIDGFNRTLGNLYRNLKYKHFYQSLSRPGAFEDLVSKGWFPFVETIGAEFKKILTHHEAGFDLAEVEQETVSSFDSKRLNRIYDRWASKPHFASRSVILKTAIEAFERKDSVSVIKIILTEIEGVLNDAHRAENSGNGAKLKVLLEFAEKAGERRAGGANTLFLPKAFGLYLREKTFANFDPVSRDGTADSRHAVGHGEAPQESYTMVRALQVLLTLDQLAFYT